jgi:hypothetical protein
MTPYAYLQAAVVGLLCAVMLYAWAKGWLR